MVIGIIPWEKFGINIFISTGFLTGSSLGNWWFSELGMWFVIMSVIIGIVYGMKEGEIVDAFLAGAADMVGVALVIGVSRGISVIMATTGLDAYVLAKASWSFSRNESNNIYDSCLFNIYGAYHSLYHLHQGLQVYQCRYLGRLAVSLGFPVQK